jgi:biotin carboxyl carrier protein
MRLIAEVEGKQFALTITRDGTRVSAEVDDRFYELEAQAKENSSYLLRYDNRVYECRIDDAGEQNGLRQVYIGNRAYAVTIIDPKRLRGTKGASAQHDGSAARIIAPMPGKVVRVLVDVGARVESGQGIIIVEAMKMQNEMKSMRAGTITQLKAEVGATVNAGDVLAVIE